MAEKLATGVGRLRSALDVANVIEMDAEGAAVPSRAVMVDAVLGTANEVVFGALGATALVKGIRAETRAAFDLNDDRGALGQRAYKASDSS